MPYTSHNFSSTNSLKHAVHTKKHFFFFHCSILILYIAISFELLKNPHEAKRWFPYTVNKSFSLNYCFYSFIQWKKCDFKISNVLSHCFISQDFQVLPTCFALFTSNRSLLSKTSIERWNFFWFIVLKHPRNTSNINSFLMSWLKRTLIKQRYRVLCNSFRNIFGSSKITHNLQSKLRKLSKTKLTWTVFSCTVWLLNSYRVTKCC